MDKVTVKIMSYSCKMPDITDEGVSCKDLLGTSEILLFIYFTLLSIRCSPSQCQI